MAGTADLKLKTARTLKWNTIDRTASQILYAITGIILANILSPADFGLVGITLAIQAFAILFVDSGFGAALLQRKDPDKADYSTVFWFNTAVSIAAYIALYFASPLIADAFDDQRLTAICRAMFLTFVLNGLGIVQTNRLMKQMNVKQIAVANVISLTISGAVGIWLALTGCGVWALVWQSIVNAGVKTVWLWITGHWMPALIFSRRSLRAVLGVGAGVFSSSLLNTAFLQIYTVIIGLFYSMSSLGVYTQADKWSKMGTASLSQILTASFVPLLSGFQDDPEQHRRVMAKTDRFTAFILFPFMGGLVIMAAPIFHTLFGQKWDAAIPLFQILCARGIFVVLTSLYGNFLLSLGYARQLVIIETIKDVMTIIAILATVFIGSVEALVWGQLAASALSYVIVLRITAVKTGYQAHLMLSDVAPYAALTLGCMTLMALLLLTSWPPVIILALQAVMGVTIYILVLRATGSVILNDALRYLTGRFRKT